jgi:hypothetical protein
MFPTNMDRYLSIFNYWETVIKQEIWGTPLSEKKISRPLSLGTVHSFPPHTHTHQKKIERQQRNCESCWVFKNDQKSGFIEIVGCDDVIIVSVPSGNFRWLARQSKGLSIARQN